MNCGRFKRLLWSYVDGALSAAEQQACEEHLTHCARCRQRLQAAQLTRASLQSLPRYAAPARLLEQVRAEIPARRADEAVAAVRRSPLATRPSRFALRSWWRWALAPALGALVALLWWWSHSPIQTPSPHLVEGYVSSQEYADTCIDMHQQLEMAEWAGTPAASYLITTGYTR